MVGLFAVLFWLPVGRERFTNGILKALRLSRWYAREHVLLCLVPAFFIAGAIGVFISQASVMKYLGGKANKFIAYGVASVSGSILAVCSCTVLPLFAGIWRMGAGLGPACAFLYSGPAINVLAIILTARILGLELGIARAVCAIVFSVVIGLAMHFIYRKEEAEKAQAQAEMPEPEVTRPLWQNGVFFAVMVAILVFANWGASNRFRFELDGGREIRAVVMQAPEDISVADAAYTLKYLAGPQAGQEIEVPASEVVSKTALPGLWTTLWKNKWVITSVFGALLGLVLIFFLAIPWWKVVLSAIVPTLLAFVVPGGGMWVMIPFTAAVIGLSIALATSRGEGEEWIGSTWEFAKQIMPLLLFGVLVAGFLLGRPGHEGLIPARYVEMLVGERPGMFLEISGLGGQSSGHRRMSPQLHEVVLGRSRVFRLRAFAACRPGLSQGCQPGDRREHRKSLRSSQAQTGLLSSLSLEF